MTGRKSERLLNLLITLLVSRSYVTKARIREAVEQYHDTPNDAFEKMFERDKEELRSLGVPIEVGFLDRSFEDDPGYRVERSAFELPEIHLEPDEAAVLGLAARVWQHAGLASATSDALVKLRAAGVSVDRDALNVAQPQLTAEEPSFDALWQATLTRTPVRFDYRAAAAPAVQRRCLQPWGVVSFRGRWYVAGYDLDRGEERIFRLSRVHGGVESAGEPGSYAVPEGTDIRTLTESLVPMKAARRATLLVRSGAAHGLRRQGRLLGPGAGAGWDRVELSFARTDTLADEVLSYGADVVVEDPADVRDLVLHRLRDTAGVAQGASPS